MTTRAPRQSGSTHVVPAADLRVWGAWFGGFALLAVIGLVVPWGALGMRILLLVVMFHLGVVVVSRRTGDRLMWQAWAVLAPLSVFMVLPDWFLSGVLGTLVFPDTGAPYIGTVPLFMAGMWTIALMPVVWIGAEVARRTSLAVGAATAGLAGFALFWAAELVAPLIPLWEPIGVQMIGGIAAYVIAPEIVLSAAAFLIVATVGRVPRAATVALVVLLPFTYTGMLATSYQFLG